MSIREKAKAPMTECECGEPLPVHLADLMGPRDSYTCSCERSYRVNCGLFVFVGMKENPLMGLDLKVEEAVCKKCEEPIDAVTVSLFHQITGKTSYPSYCMECMGDTLTSGDPPDRSHGDTRRKE